MTETDRFWNIINSDLRRYQDLGALKKWNRLHLLINAFICNDHRLAFTFWLRLLSFRPGKFIRAIARLMYNRLSSKYGLLIPTETKIGSGLYIGHGMSIVVNGKTRIGTNCNLSHFITIGSNKGTPANIGDNVYIGPGVSIVEDVTIGNNVKIGAGTVVINDIPDNSTSVGNPNRIISKHL